MVRKPVAKVPRARGSAPAVRKRPRKVAAKKRLARRSPAKEAAKGGPVPGTPSPMRTRMTPELQAHVKRLYEETDQPICQIALDVGINESIIRRMGPREGWVRYVAPPRDLPPLATLLAEVEQLEASVKAAPLPSLPPRSGGEGRFGERERDETGWGDVEPRLESQVEPRASLPPTPNPSPPFEERTGGGEKKACDNGDNLARFIRVVMAHLDEFEALRRDGKLLPKHHLHTARAISILTEAFNRLQRLRASSNGPIHDDIADMPADLDAYRVELARQIDAFIASRANAGVAGEPVAAPVDGTEA